MKGKLITCAILAAALGLSSAYAANVCPQYVKADHGQLKFYDANMNPYAGSAKWHLVSAEPISKELFEFNAAESILRNPATPYQADCNFTSKTNNNHVVTLGSGNLYPKGYQPNAKDIVPKPWVTYNARGSYYQAAGCGNQDGSPATAAACQLQKGQ